MELGSIQGFKKYFGLKTKNRLAKTAKQII